MNIPKPIYANGQTATLLGNIKHPAHVKNLTASVGFAWITFVSTINPGIIIHTAAIKHVDSAEKQPLEMVKTNIIGSKNVIDTSGAGDGYNSTYISNFLLTANPLQSLQKASKVGAKKLARIG